MHLICLHNVIKGPCDAFDEKCSRISEGEFERFLDAVTRGFDLVSYSTYVTRLAEGRAADNTVALSFDDGFQGVHDHALPILSERGLDAVAFLNPPFLGNPPGQLFHFLELEIAFRLTRATGLDMAGQTFAFTDETARVKAMKKVKKHLKTRPEAERARGHAMVIEALGVARAAMFDFLKDDPRFEIMGDAEVTALHDAGWTIGSHGTSHRTLAMLSEDEVAEEIGAAARAFADRFGWANLPFAYPYGDAIHVGDAAPRLVAEAGHPMAFTTQSGASDLARDPFRLPRIDYKRFLRDYGLLEAA